MKPLLLLVLLSSAGLLCCAAPAPVACTDDGMAAAARLAMQHINSCHHHGYKFRLNQTLEHRLEETDDGCNVELRLGLLETKCHVLNPTPFEDCPLREELARAVKADCNVSVTVSSGEAKVVKYLCDTEQVKSNEDMVRICPDCYSLIALNSSEGLKATEEAVKIFNQNTSNTHYYILKEVGRVSAGHMMMMGMSYHVEFALVETYCPMGSRIVIEACKPRCPDRARHAFCSSSYSSTNGLGSVECEFYPPQNTTAPDPDDKETSCRGRHHGHGPPPHARDHGHGPPPHAHDHGHGPPPHAHGNDRNHSNDRDHGHGRGHGNDHGKKQRPHGNDHAHGPPPHAHGPPPHAHGPPPHAHGPPPHAHGIDRNHSNDHGKKQRPHGNDHGHSHDHGHGRWPHHSPFPPCHGFLTRVDPALHPICPWPYPEPKHKPKPSQA